MFSAKSFVAAVVAVAFASEASAFSFPSSWSSCFEKYNVTSEPSLCAPAYKTLVSNCIASSGNSTEYSSWLCSYCSNSTSSACSSSVSASTTLASSYFPTAPVVTPTGSGAPAPYSNGTTATYTTSAISTAPSTYATSTSGPVPYTGGAAAMVPGALALVGGVGAALFL